ncbi:MAG: energy transducer TonB, partial [bacterium]
NMKFSKNIFIYLSLIFLIFVSVQNCEKKSEIKMPEGVIVSGDSVYFPEVFSKIDDTRNSINECFPSLDSIPRIINTVRPIYPKDAIDSGIEGTVMVKVWVDEKGKPLLAVIMKSSNKIFNEQSLIASMNCTFTPPIIRDKPIGTWIILPYVFTLK